MLERDRLESNKVSTPQAVTSDTEHDVGARKVHVRPSDYVQWLDDRSQSYPARPDGPAAPREPPGRRAVAGRTYRTLQP